MNTQDPGIEQTGSITLDTNDLSSTASRADDLDHDDLNKSIPHRPALLSPEAKEDRCAEVQKQIHHLEQEIATNTVESKRHFIKSAAYNHQYLDLRKTIGDTAQPLILDTSNETQLQQITTLITLDTGRARVFSAATKGLRRELQIVQELKALFLEMAELKGAVGTPEYQEALDDILDKVEKQKETRRILGRKLLAALCGNGDT